ncbi:diaminopimelate epimerase [Novosphingopyxis sp.]|uniref:diaminopimelate epimerase n=1 Tax=Novosphingopyxis sp. TaxID=2709690 RepID=UPI003B5A78BE
MHNGRFHKMHGLGNDFVIVDARKEHFAPPPAMAAAIADRYKGIGCDQLIVLTRSRAADVAMRIFNADGSEAEACGNATRCVVALIGRDVTVETVAGLLEGHAGDLPEVAMGMPSFDWQAIPLAYAVDTSAMPVGYGPLERPMAVNIGNPHAVFFVGDVNAVDLAALGPEIEHDALFPERVNVNVAAVRGDGGLDLRVWERGAGLTLACGSGACATAIAAIRKGLATSPVAVHLPGGVLTVDWAEGKPVRMRGSASYVFSGRTDWSRFG